MGQGELDEERRFLNKWEMHKALEGEEIGPCQLPETLLFSREALVELLGRHGSVYVKPVDTWGGRGISRVEREGDGWMWHLQGEASQRYGSLEELVDAVEPVYAAKHSIVQQTAPLMSWQGRVFDIRVHMQREVEGHWVCGGELVRVSGADSIVSNVAISGGDVQPLDTVLGDLFDLNDLKNRLCATGLGVCLALESYRVFTEIGLDLGLSEDGQLWLIEVNTDDAISGPSHELFEKLPDQTYATAIRKRWQARQLGMFTLFLEWMREGEVQEE